MKDMRVAAAQSAIDPPVAGPRPRADAPRRTERKRQDDRTLRFGLLLNTQFPPGESASKRLEGLLDQVRAARDNGLHSLGVSQHYLATPFQMLQ